jgi:hypothetical protein
MDVAEARREFVGGAELAPPRDADDDFSCLRYRVSYPSIDCAFRTLYRTCPGCLDCEQGRFNLKRHRATLLRRRPLSPIK